MCVNFVPAAVTLTAILPYVLVTSYVCEDLLLSTSMLALSWPSILSVLVISLPLPLAAALLPECKLLSLNFDTISPHGTKSGNVHQDPSTVAARVNSSERVCCILDTVSPPREKACSTSVEVASQLSDIVNKVRIVKHYLV